MATVTFKQTETMKVYRGASADNLQAFEFKKAGEYEVPDEKAAQLCADFPANFSAKGFTPTANKAAMGPTHNK